MERPTSENEIAKKSGDCGSSSTKWAGRVEIFVIAERRLKREKAENQLQCQNSSLKISEVTRQRGFTIPLFVRIRTVARLAKRIQGQNNNTFRCVMIHFLTGISIGSKIAIRLEI